MVRAVDQRDVKIDHREAERAVLERVDDALLDRRDIVARHHAAGDLFLEGEARAARHRLDVEHDIAVLAVAARLLLVPAALDDAFADGLAVADARLTPLDGDAVAVAQPFGGDAQMHLALTPQHHLVRLRIVHDGDRGILLGELVERLAELHVVLALLGRDRDGEHRRIGARPWRSADAAACRRSACRRSWPCRAWRRRRSRRASAGPRFSLLWPTSLKTPATRPTSSSPDSEGRAVAGLTREHPRDRHLAAVRRVLRLEHIGDGFAAAPSRRGVWRFPRCPAIRGATPSSAAKRRWRGPRSPSAPGTPAPRAVRA